MTSNSWTNFKMLIEHLEKIVFIGNQMLNDPSANADQVELLERINIGLTDELLRSEREKKELLELNRHLAQKSKIRIVIIVILSIICIALGYLLYKQRLKERRQRRKFRELYADIEDLSKDAEKFERWYNEVKDANDMLHLDLEEFRKRYQEAYDKVHESDRLLEQEKQERMVLEEELKRILNELKKY